MAETPRSETEFDIELHYTRAFDLFRAFVTDGNREALESGIKIGEIVVRCAPKASEKYLKMTWILAQHISERGNVCDGVPVDLERSVCLCNTWLEEAPDSHFERPFVCCLLAGLLKTRFKYSSNRGDLEEALRLAYRAVELSHLDPKYHLLYFCTVKDQLQGIYEIFEEPEILDRLILAKRRVLEECTKRNQAKHWPDIDDLERGLYQRFEKTGNIVDLQEALPLARDVCKLVPDGYPRKCNAFSHCSYILAKNHEAGLVPLSAMDESIEMLHTALHICPSGSDDRAGILANLMNRHREAYERGRGVQLLHLAIEYGKQTLAEASADHPERPNFQQGLAVCLKALFEYSGQRFLLDEAIEGYRTVVASPHLPSDDRAVISSNLAIALKARYETSGALRDIEEAVSRDRESVSWTSAKSHHRSSRLNGLGTSLSFLYNRFKRLEDLNEAIDCAKEAEACAWDRSDHGMYLSNLSIKLSTRYKCTSNDEDRSESLMLARKAVEVSHKSEWMSYAMNIHNLATRIYEEYLSTVKSERNVAELEEAISWTRAALDCTPKTHTLWSYYAYWLGWRQMELATCATDVEKGRALYDEAIETLKEASMPESASPMRRLNAARTAALMLISRERWAEAKELSTKTIALLSHVSPRSMTRQDMQFRLSGLSNLSTFAAAASLNSGGKSEDALTLLEMGRGLIFGLLIGDRADVSDLTSINPALSSQYEEMRDQLARLSISTSSRDDVVLHRQELTKRLASLEDQIRELPGLSRFQLPASGDELKGLASEGPLVSFNVTKFRSDAFIVTSQDIVVVPLPALQEADLETNVRKIIGRSRLTKCTLVERHTSNKNLAKMLVWLWEVAVQPVMNHLGLAGASGSTASNLSRLWWVTSGLMGLMPLHAAGSGWDSSPDNTSSRCISSYVHTMKALAHSRSTRAKQPPQNLPSRILAVHTPNTKENGRADLNTGPEMAAITSAASRAGLPCTVLESPTVSSVISEMRRSPIVHFACHGDPSFDDPSETSLVLSPADAAAAPDDDGRLTISQLFDETHTHAQLAYLSACCTAQQYDEGLIDEGIHLGSVFQLMGFPAVVATLWEADDGAAIEVAGAFYRRLLGRNLRKMEDGHVARCLHDAVAELRAQRLGRRKRKAEDILAWAPFVHIGI